MNNKASPPSDHNKNIRDLWLTYLQDERKILDFVGRLILHEVRVASFNKCSSIQTLWIFRAPSYDTCHGLLGHSEHSVYLSRFR